MLEEFFDFVRLLLGGLAGLGRTSTDTQTLVAENQLVGHRAAVESLHVGIADDKVNTRDSFAEHVVDSVVATTAYTNDFDVRRLVERRVKSDKL